MDWLPRLNIYRSTLEDSRLTPARRGILAHLCLEHLILSDPANAAQRLKDARRAVRQGMRLFPLPVDDPEAVAGEMEACLAWFAALPQAPLWLAHGLREQGVIDARGNMHRVDLLVDEALYHSGDAAARPETALVNGETTDLPPRSAFLHAIDYKTGRAASDEVREEHRRQVRRYMRLASQARGRPARGTLVYLDERRIEEVQP